MIEPFAGIDYGSKLAGTTVIAEVSGARVGFRAASKGTDADAFILDWARETRPAHLFLDAPLSLPGVYLSLPGRADFFYREADRALRAMSPMFLGGLTARAMRLKHDLQQLGIEVHEAYPAALAREWDLGTLGYKKKGSAAKIALEVLHYSGLAAELPEKFNGHALDALLAACTGKRYFEGTAAVYGDPEEGLILV